MIKSSFGISGLMKSMEVRGPESALLRPYDMWLNYQIKRQDSFKAGLRWASETSALINMAALRWMILLHVFYVRMWKPDAGDKSGCSFVRRDLKT